LLRLLRSGDTGTRHLEWIENRIELLGGKQVIPQMSSWTGVPLTIASRAMRAAVS
jgi:hypothetical protein